MDAQHQGRVSPTQVRIITDCLGALDKAGIDPDHVVELEEALVADAQGFGPRELRSSTETIIDLYLPDGTEPRDGLINDQRSLTLQKTSDGSYKLSGKLTPAAGAGPLGGAVPG